MGVYTKERKGVTAKVLMATPCTNSLGGESGGQKHEGCGGRSACWKYAAVSGSGAAAIVVDDIYSYFSFLLFLREVQTNKAPNFPRKRRARCSASFSS